MTSKNSPDYVQTSTAAAMTLKYFPGRFYRNARLNALNLLVTYEDGCKGRCGYCGLSNAREIKTESDKTFIRVDWPVLPVDEVIERTIKYAPHFQRVCVSMITHPRAVENTITIMKRFKDETDLLISGLISPTLIRKKETLQEIKDSGADMVGIAIDAATPELFEKFRGKGVKGPHKWDHYWDVVEQSVEVFGKYKVGVHLIVGLGETEEEMIKIIQRAQDIGAGTHLFSFFPESGSFMEEYGQPTYGQYRRVQLARYLINESISEYSKMSFDDNGQVIEFGVDTSEIVKNGEAFMTSGCAGKDCKAACNRPFGNERPSRPIRNYPFLPNEDDIEIVTEQLKEA
jgi:biotin synthase